VAAAVRQQAPEAAVTCAYLELCEPGLPEACSTLVAQGVRHLRVLPVFFGMGKHAREDLPRLVHELQEAHPQVTFTLLPAAGEHPALTRLLGQMALGTLETPT
jgi:sirohydrochlorin cobaltochelatase